MITFWILVFLYCFLLPMLYLWWERRKMQKDIPYLIHDSLNAWWTDNGKIFEAINNMSDWTKTRNEYYRLYGQVLEEEFRHELTGKELQKAEEIMKTRNNGTIYNFFKNNF